MSFNLKKDEINGKTFSVVKYDKNGTYEVVSGYYPKKELNAFLIGVAYGKKSI